MRLLGIDIESTGLNVEVDRPLKIGGILYETGNQTPLFEKEWTLWSDTYPEITASAFKAHGITKKSCQEFGEDPTEVFERLARLIDEHDIDYLIAHNGNAFDFPMLINSADAFAANLRNFFRNRLTIDTKLDVPYPGHMKSRGLVLLAAEHGFLNPFPHSALSDIRTMMKIFFMYPLGDIIDRSKSPIVTVAANVTYDLRHLAKDAGFRWEEKIKFWTKNIKLCEMDALQKTVDFEIRKVG